MAAPVVLPATEADKEEPILRVGLIADVQYGEKPDDGTKRYRTALSKLEASVSEWTKLGVDFVVSLGDLVDGSSEVPRPPHTAAELERALAAFGALLAYHVVGNHCLYVCKDKDAVVRSMGWPGADKAYGRVESRFGIRFILLDGTNVSLFANVPGSPNHVRAKQWLAEHPKAQHAFANDWNAALDSEQMQWLETELQDALQHHEKCAIFCHYPLVDRAGGPRHLLWNHGDLNALLERNAGAVLAFFSGHFHQGGCAFERGVLHWSLPAALECPPGVAAGGFVLEVSPSWWRVRALSDPYHSSVEAERWAVAAAAPDLGIGQHPFEVAIKR